MKCIYCVGRLCKQTVLTRQTEERLSSGVYLETPESGRSKRRGRVATGQPPRPRRPHYVTNCWERADGFLVQVLTD
ncbi:hypothetical protein KGM_207716 [Danaus plexippus plexippus]|uniref:Uncharacterized protein n=1 Tax=Danaus plexippus plexippus TaxID=278856 RepID=A0A212FBL3_DANPL|nr:hypothetical protein KGM_207716 [Danaus plexippus plexippus]